MGEKGRAEVRDNTRLSGRALRLARWAWVALALTFGLLYLAGLPANISEHAADKILGDNFPDWSRDEINQSFAALGLKPETFAAVSQWVNLLLEPAYMLLGAFLFWRRSDDWLALLLAGILVSFLATDAVATAFGVNALTRRIDEATGTVVGGAALLLLLIFPDGRFVPRWTRWVGAYMGLTQLARLVVGRTWYEANGLVLVGPVLAMIVVSQIYRYFRWADPMQRQQIKWVVFGVAATMSPIVVYAAVQASLPAARQPGVTALAWQLVGVVPWAGFLILWPTGLIIAVLRYRLWDIDVIIRRTLIYSALTAVLGLAYFGSVLALENVLRGLTGQGQNALVVVLSTLAIAALFGPVRGRVQRGIDRRFYRRKYDAARTLAAFGTQVRDVVELEQLSGQLLGVVQETMQPASVGLWLRGSKSGSQNEQ